ncbi:MAG: hypothetical protein IJ711_12865 [Lachnospiraceae bacterium]|nr:hypothetical protein [Lachnospiraceae bacterium]
MKEEKYNIPRLDRHYYTILDNRILVMCASVRDEQSLEETVLFFEHVVNRKVGTACCVFPDFRWIDRGDFSQDEIKGFEKFWQENKSEIKAYAAHPDEERVSSEEEARLCEQILCPDGPRYAYRCIDEGSEQYDVTEQEKERILTKISSYIPRPTHLLIAFYAVLSAAFVCAFLTVKDMTATGIGYVQYLEFALLLLLLVVLIVMGLCTKLLLYFEWEQDRSKIRKNTLYKTRVTPLCAWRGSGLFPSHYLRFASADGLYFCDFYTISEELHNQIRSKEVWAYYYKVKEKNDRYYGCFRIYVVGKDINP